MSNRLKSLLRHTAEGGRRILPEWLFEPVPMIVAVLLGLVGVTAGVLLKGSVDEQVADEVAVKLPCESDPNSEACQKSLASRVRALRQEGACILVRTAEAYVEIDGRKLPVRCSISEAVEGEVTQGRSEADAQTDPPLAEQRRPGSGVNDGRDTGRDKKEGDNGENGTGTGNEEGVDTDEQGTEATRVCSPPVVIDGIIQIPARCVVVEGGTAHP